MLRESTGTGRDDSQPPTLATDDRMPLSSSEAGEEWREYIRSIYLKPGMSDTENDLGYSRFRLKGCWLFVYRILRLPWTAIVLITGAIALICFFVVFIVNGPSSRPSNTVIVNGTQVVSGSSNNLVTIQCETDVSKEECERRARDRVAARDFQQAMKETHLFTTLIMFWLAATIFFVIKAVRIRKKYRYLDSLPRSSMPVFSDLIPPSQQSSSGTAIAGGGTSQLNTMVGSIMVQQQAQGAANQTSGPNLHSLTSAPANTNIGQPQNAPGTSSNSTNTAVLQDDVTSWMVSKVPVHQQMKRSVSLRRYLQYYAEPGGESKPSDSNWGWQGEYEGIHFPSTIQNAVRKGLVAKVTALSKDLTIEESQTVRDWLMMLKSELLPNESGLDELADIYERAKFGEENLDEETWYHRIHRVYEVSRRIEDALLQRRIKGDPPGPSVLPGVDEAGFIRPVSMASTGSLFPSTPHTHDLSYKTAKQEEDSPSIPNSSGLDPLDISKAGDSPERSLEALTTSPIPSQEPDTTSTHVQLFLTPPRPQASKNRQTLPVGIFEGRVMSNETSVHIDDAFSPPQTTERPDTSRVSRVSDDERSPRRFVRNLRSGSL